MALFRCPWKWKSDGRNCWPRRQGPGQRFGDAYKQPVHLVQIVAELVLIEEALAHGLAPGPVRAGGFLHLGEGKHPLLEDESADGVEGVGDVRDTENVYGGELVIDAALIHHVDATLDGTVAVHGGEHLGPQRPQQFVLAVLQLTQGLRGAGELRLEDRVEAGEVGHALLDGGSDGALHGHQQVEGVHVLVAILLAGNAEPLAATIDNLPGILLRDSGAQLRVAHQIIVHQYGNALAVAGEDIAGVGVELRVDVRVPHDAQVVVVANQVIGFQDDETHLVGRVLPFGIAPADAEEVSAQLEEDLREVFTRLVVAQFAGTLAVAVEVDQVQVQPTIPVAMADHAVEQHRKVDPLHALVVGARRVHGDVFAAVGNAQVGLLLPSVSFALREFAGPVGVALDEPDRRFADHLQAM